MTKPYVTRVLAELEELAEAPEVGVYELLPEGDAAKLL